MVRRLLPVIVVLLALTPAPAAAHDVLTHGDPASALPDGLITGPVAQQELGGGVVVNFERSGGLPETWCGTETTDDDTLNEVTTDPHFKVVYAYASDQPNRFTELADKLQASVSLLSRYLAGQSGGALTVRFDMGTSCGPEYADIEVVALPQPLSSYVVAGSPDFVRLSADVRAASPLPPGSARNLLVYADGFRGTDGVAGAGESVEDDSAGAGNAHNAGGRLAAAFAPAAVPSGTYAEPATLMHELAHNLGAVQDSAPNSTGAGHCTDEHDVVCYADGGPDNAMTTPCPQPEGEVVDSTFDCGADDYFGPSPGAGSYLETHWNLFDSVHLAPCSQVGAACGDADRTPPVNTTPVPPAGWVTAPYQVVLSAFDNDSGVDRMHWKVGATGPIQDAEAGDTVTLSADGTHALFTRAIDVAGNESTWREDTVRVDATDPVDLTDPVDGWQDAPVTATVLGSDATSGLDHVEWRVNGGTVQTGPSGSEVEIAADGTTTLSTRAVDVAGNASAWRDHQVRVDTVTPTDVTAATGGWQTAPLTVTVAGSDEHSGIAQVRWRLDGGAVQTTATANVSGDGEHTLLTQVADAAGNETGWKSHTIRIDTTAPVNQTPAADGAWRDGDYTVLVSGADGGSGFKHMEWRIDGGPVQSGASGSQVTVTGTADHTFETRAVDVAGNASGWRAEHVRIDTLPPTNTTATPGGPVPNPYQVAVTGTDAHAGVAEVEWQVDDGPVRSSAQAVVEGHGTHSLKTRVIDGAGNASPWRTDTVVIDVALNADTAPPTDTTTAAPAGWRATPVTMTVAATDSGSGVERLEWRLDGQPMQTHLGASVQVPIADEGVHELETRAWDASGNFSGWRLQTVRLDFTVPADATSIGPGWQNEPAFRLQGEDALSGVEEIEYRIAGGPLLTAADGEEIDPGGDGEYAVARRVIDRAGHASAWRTDTLRIDTVAPANTTPVPASSWSAPLSLALAGTDDRSGVATMQWRIGSGSVVHGGPASVSEDGVHSLSTRAVDQAGNASAWRTDTVRVDVTDPVNDTAQAPGGWRAAAYVVALAGSDGTGSGVDRLEWSVDGGPVSEAPDAVVEGDGVHTLRTRVVDVAGRRSAWREEVIRIDTVAPAVSVSCPDGWSAAPVSCAIAADGGPSGLSALTPGETVVVEAEGEHVVDARAVDGAGNAAGAQSRVRVDRSAPEVSLSCDDHRCTVAASDAVSGVAAVAYSVDGGEWKAVDGPFTVAAGAVRARVADVAGNQAVTAPVTVEADSPSGRKPGRARSASRPVYLRGQHGTEGMVGALRASRSASGTIRVDLRPLAVGPGRYKVQLRVKAGKRSRKVTRTRRVKPRGALPRLRTTLTRATARATIELVVRKSTGGRWRRHATARVVLPR